MCTLNSLNTLLPADVDPALFESGLNKVIARYDILRTVFTYEGLIEPLQIVLKDRKTALYYEDISSCRKRNNESILANTGLRTGRTGSIRARDLLIRFALFKTGEYLHFLLLTYHHILMDGWCIGIILKDLKKIYRSIESRIYQEPEAVTPYRIISIG